MAAGGHGEGEAGISREQAAHAPIQQNEAAPADARKGCEKDAPWIERAADLRAEQGYA
jgi:hypothetical protein